MRAEKPITSKGRLPVLTAFRSGAVRRRTKESRMQGTARRKAQRQPTWVAMMPPKRLEKLAQPAVERDQ